MSNEEKKSGIFEGFDPLGLKSAGEISKDIVKLGTDSVKAFLNITCKPLLEELGLDVKDRYRSWRLLNIIKILEKAHGKLNYDLENERLVIDPRIAFQIANYASIISNDTLQEMWAGLFAASCKSYEEDENILFVDLLNRLTASQVKLLTHLCLNSHMNINISDLPDTRIQGLVNPGVVKIKYAEIMSIMETAHSIKVDSELIALESMGLIVYQGSATQGMTIAQIVKGGTFNGLKPTMLSVLLFVRCQGSNYTPYEYFLPEITNYYYQLVRNYIDTNPLEVLEKIYAMNLIGKQYENDLEFGSEGFKIKNIEWKLLSRDELTFRLRHYMIFRCITYIENYYTVNLLSEIFGEFSFKNGLNSLEGNVIIK